MTIAEILNTEIAEIAAIQGLDADPREQGLLALGLEFQQALGVGRPEKIAKKILALRSTERDGSDLHFASSRWESLLAPTLPRVESFQDIGRGGSAAYCRFEVKFQDGTVLVCYDDGLWRAGFGWHYTAIEDSGATPEQKVAMWNHIAAEEEAWYASEEEGVREYARGLDVSIPRAEAIEMVADYVADRGDQCPISWRRAREIALEVL